MQSCVQSEETPHPTEENPATPLATFRAPEAKSEAASRQIGRLAWIRLWVVFTDPPLPRSGYEGGTKMLKDTGNQPLSCYPKWLTKAVERHEL